MSRFKPVIILRLISLLIVEDETLGDILSAIKVEALISTLAPKKLKKRFRATSQHTGR